MNPQQDASSLSTAALLRAKEKAETASRAKSEYLGIVSHELRMPLTSILGMAHMLNIEYLLPAQREQVEDIINASEYLLSLIDDLLDIAKLDTGKIALHSNPLDLRKLLEDVTATLTFQTKAKGLELIVNYEPNVPHLVLGDERALRQIVLNLVGNAMKFTERGYILIRVTCSHQTDAQAELVLSIEDTGVGIERDKLQALLDSFQENNVNCQRRYSSSGLGLTISKTYTELMGGKMQACSVRGKGSMFSCTIPFTLQPRAAIDCVSEGRRDQDAGKRRVQGCTFPKNAIDDRKDTTSSAINILLVEDDKLIQKVHKKMLEHAGCAVTIAENGPQALSLYNQDYDAIFLDVGLPRMNGLEVATEIRKHENGRWHVPIIALTGFVHEEDRRNCLAVGIDDVATKPIMVNALQTLLQQWVINKK